jgi:hypothetical protein
MHDRLIEPHAGNAGQDVDLVRRTTQFERLPPCQPGVDVDLSGWATEPEVLQGRDQALRVLAVGPDEGVEVLAVARRPMHRHRLAADNDVLDTVAIQALAERLEVGLDVATKGRSRVAWQPGKAP